MQIKLSRYRIVIEFHADMPAIDYIGSKLRGAFGWAFRSISCATKQTHCNGCKVSNACTFAQLFAPEHLQKSIDSKVRAPSAPYLIQVLDDSSTKYLKGEQLAFDFILLGEYQAYLPLVIEAWQRACMFGLGTKNNKTSLTLRNVYQQEDNLNDWRLLFDADVGLIECTRSTILIPSISTNENCDFVNLNIELSTPLRLQKNSKPIQVKQLTPELFFLGLKRRVNILNKSYLHSDELAKNLNYISNQQLQKISADNRQLTWFKWQRFSHRQKQYMDFDGIKGVWLWTLPTKTLVQLWPLLYLGQWLNLGKNTTFGLGQYQIELN